MSDVRLTRKQITFLMDRLGEEDPEKAATRFIELMVIEKADTNDVVFYLNKVMERVEKK